MLADTAEEAAIEMTAAMKAPTTLQMMTVMMMVRVFLSLFKSPVMITVLSDCQFQYSTVNKFTTSVIELES